MSESGYRINPPTTDGYDQPPTDTMEDPPLAGDHTDDDGQALDDILTPVAWGPVEHESRAYEKQDLPIVTRLLKRAVSLGPIDIDNPATTDYIPPVMIFPADPNRKHLYIMQDNGIGAVCLGSDASDCYDLTCINPGTNLDAPFTIDDHTGALWLYVDPRNPLNQTDGVPNLDQLVKLQIVAVTS